MGVSILLRDIGGVDDKKAVLANGGFARTLSIGTNWTKLRIALRACMTDSGADVTGTPRWAVGVCSGVTNTFGDATCTNFAGVVSNNATWSRGSSTPSAWYNISNYLYPAKKINTTLTFGGTPITGNPGHYFGAVPASGWRNMYFVDILKGSPNYSFYVFWNSVVADVSVATFLAKAESASPSATNYGYSGPQTLAVDESAGSFNSINVFWDHMSPAIEISDLAVCKLS